MRKREVNRLPQPQTFVRSDNDLLRIAVTARNFARLPSELLKIDYGVAALDFDLACSHRLQIFDNQNKVDETIALAKAIAVCSGWASPEIFEGESADLTESEQAMLESKIETFHAQKKGEK